MRKQGRERFDGASFAMVLQGKRVVREASIAASENEVRILKSVEEYFDISWKSVI